MNHIALDGILSISIYTTRQLQLSALLKVPRIVLMVTWPQPLYHLFTEAFLSCCDFEICFS